MATDRLGSILAFVRVADTGSFAGAGRTLGLSPSAVSKGVARLEQRLGLRLFQRTTRALALTDDGRLFHARCAAVLADLDEAEAAMRERAAAPQGVLRIEVPTALGRSVILPALTRLTDRHSGLRVEATLDDRLADPIKAGLDAVVRIGEPRDTRLVARRVGTVRYVVCGAPTYLAAHRAPSSVDDLQHYDCVGRVTGPGSTRATWKFAHPETGAPFERQVGGRLAFNSNDAILDAGLAGAGLVQLHGYVVEPHLRAGRLVQVLADHAVEGPPISVLLPSSRRLAPRVRAFIDFTVDLFARDVPRPPRSTS